MEKTRKKYFALFALPGIICFLIAFLIPMIMGIFLSFCEFTNVTNAKWVGLDNYIKAFSIDNYFTSALWRRSEENTSEIQSHSEISYSVVCFEKQIISISHYI